MDDLERIVDLIVTAVEREERPAAWLDANGAGGLAVIRAEQVKRPPWTAEEEAFLLENLAQIGIEEAARRLGRSRMAVKVRATRIGATMPRHAPGYLSTNQIAKILGVDSHIPPTWVDLGILEGERFPYDPSGPPKRRVRVEVFKRWLIRPRSWVYFKVERIRVAHFRRLVELAQQRWGDEWWTTRQAADYLGCDPKLILHNILHGRIYGLRVPGHSRRRKQRWAYWYVRRSEIEKFRLPTKRDSRLKFTARADEFMVRARVEWGLPAAVIARMMKYPGSYKSVDYRIRRLCQERGIKPPPLPQKAGKRGGGLEDKNG